MDFMADAHVHFGKRGEFDAQQETEALIRDMDRNHLEKVFLFPVGCTRERNDQVLAAAKAYPDRLIPFLWLHPAEKENLPYFEKALQSGKIGGLKLHPYSGKYRIDDFDLLEPWMELVKAYRRHVIVHCTSGDAFCSPAQLEQLAARYPETTFQMAHMGAIWQCSEGMEIVKRNRNIYADTSIVSYSAVTRAGKSIPDKLLMGTDYPFYRFEMEQLKLRLAVEDEATLNRICCQNFMDLCHRLMD